MKNSEFTQAGFESTFEKVFILNEPIGYLFTSSIPKRALIFPTLTMLTENYMLAIMKALIAVHDEGFYVSTLPRWGFPDVCVRHWYIQKENWREYFNIGWLGVAENVMLSPSGLWGVSMFLDESGIIGGSDDFMDVLEVELPNLNNSAIEYVKHIKRQPTYFRGGELESLNVVFLSHIFGDEYAKVLMETK